MFPSNPSSPSPRHKPRTLGSGFRPIPGLALASVLTPVLALFALGLGLAPAHAQRDELPPSAAEGHLTPLAPIPDWTLLEPYQLTLTRQEFTDRLTHLYATDAASAATFNRYASIDDDEAVFYADENRMVARFHLHFAPSADDKLSLIHI